MPIPQSAIIVHERTFASLGVEIEYLVGDRQRVRNAKVQIEFRIGESERDFRVRREAELGAAIQTTLNELGG